MWPGKFHGDDGPRNLRCVAVSPQVRSTWGYLIYYGTTPAPLDLAEPDGTVNKCLVLTRATLFEPMTSLWLTFVCFALNPVELGFQSLDLAAVHDSPFAPHLQ